MPLFLADWHQTLLRHHSLFTVAVVAGYATWAWFSRRHPAAPLSRRARTALFLLLAATPMAWWLTGKQLQREDVLPPPPPRNEIPLPESLPGLPAPLAARITESMEIDLPHGASFVSPDTARVIEHKDVLMLLPPAHVEWPIDTAVRAVSIGYGVHPDAYGDGRTDGIDLFLEQVDEQATRQIFHRHLDPQRKPEDRGEHRETIVLPPFSRSSKLVLHTGSGTANDGSWDWLYLSAFRARRAPGFLPGQFPGFNRLPNAINVGLTGIAQGDDEQGFLFIGPPSKLEFLLQAQDRQLVVEYGFAPSAYANGGKSNGAILRIELVTATGEPVRLYEYYAKPLENKADRDLLQASIPLPAHQPGDRLVLQFLAGDNNDAGWDHTFIRHLTFH